MSIADSKKLIKILRHTAKDHGLLIDESGFIKISEILKLPEFQNLNHQSILKISSDCPKQRFHIKNNTFISANQGHSFNINSNLTMEKLTLQNISKFNIDPSRIVHGTYFKAWELIKKSGALNKMSRQHIHFANGIPGESEVISGMRKSCQVIIHLDLIKAIESGLTFYLSKNNVILSEGNSTGNISSELFAKVINRGTGETLHF